MRFSPFTVGGFGAVHAFNRKQNKQAAINFLLAILIPFIGLDEVAIIVKCILHFNLFIVNHNSPFKGCHD